MFIIIGYASCKNLAGRVLDLAGSVIPGHGRGESPGLCIRVLHGTVELEESRVNPLAVPGRLPDQPVQTSDVHGLHWQQT